MVTFLWEMGIDLLYVAVGFDVLAWCEPLPAWGRLSSLNCVEDLSGVGLVAHTLVRVHVQELQGMARGFRLGCLVDHVDELPLCILLLNPAIIKKKKKKKIIRGGIWKSAFPRKIRIKSFG